MLTRLTTFLILFAWAQTVHSQEKWPPPQRAFSAGYVYSGFHEAELGMMLSFMRWYTPKHEYDDFAPGGTRYVPIYYTHSIVLGAGYAPAKQLTAFRLGYQYTTEQGVRQITGRAALLGRISGETRTDFVHWVPSLTVEIGLQVKITKDWDGFMGNSALSISGGIIFSQRDAAFGQKGVGPLIRLNWMFG